MNSINSENPPTEARFEDLLEDFHKGISKSIVRIWDQEENNALLKDLAQATDAICTEVLEIGDSANKKIGEENSTIVHYLMNYEWPNRAKSFLVLWRDIVFQLQKAWLKVSVGEAKLEGFNQLKRESKSVLQDAAFDFSNFLAEERQKIANPSTQIYKWNLQDNPWPIYKEQIKKLPEQNQLLFAQNKTLWNASGVYVLISSECNDFFQTRLDGIVEMRAVFNKLIAEIEDKEEVEIKDITAPIESIYNQSIAKDGLNVFQKKIEENLGALPSENKIAVDTSGGYLMYKDLDLRKNSRSWLESEINPDIYDLNRINESIYNKLNLSIVNLKSRFEGEEDSKQMVLTSLNNLIRSLEKPKERIENLQKRVQTKMNEHFRLTKIYEDNFLPVSVQYTLNQYRDSQKKNWQYVSDWFKDRLNFLQVFRKSVLEEETLSNAEKIVRVVLNRSPQAENNHYTTMFLTKGYIGDSFFVGRNEELNHVKSLIDNWKLGYRGAVAITGKRFCGKSTFGEVIGHRYFNSQTINLKPNTKFVFAGRHFETGYDLKPVLDFITKHSLNQNHMVWIDDLELWQDDKVSTGENAEYLLKTIDQYSTRLFFAVSMSNNLKTHLNKYFSINKVFQSEINLDKMTVAEVQQAVIIRHSATQMELIDEDREEVSQGVFEKEIKRLCKTVEGNIGEALQSWSYMIEKYDDERVMKKDFRNYTLPNFIGADSAILLKTIFFLKRTNEYRLRKLFGPAFKDHYNVTLQRLLNLGVLERENSWLQINPFLVNSVGTQLEQKSTLSFLYNQETSKNAKL